MGRRKRQSTVHGWLVLDKPVGLSSNGALSRIKRLFDCPKAGHAGTLDPLASGLLPVALGEATKTIPYVVDGEKTYTFEVTWGDATSTDDLEGEVIASSAERPDGADIDAILRRFIGRITQTPPRFSAIRIDGDRAYARARRGEEVDIPERDVVVHALERTSDAEGAQIKTAFRCDCGKGTYIRSLARDMGEALGCFGHVSELRRTRVGDFHGSDMVALATLEEAGEPHVHLQPVEAGLHRISMVEVSVGDAETLRRGQAISVVGESAIHEDNIVAVSCRGTLIALAQKTGLTLAPKRIFHL